MNTWRKIRFQIAFDIKKEHIFLLKIINDELWSDKIKIKIAQNTREIKSNLLEKLLVLIKVLSSNTKFKIFIDLFIDFEKNKSIIVNFFSKKITDKWFNNFSGFSNNSHPEKNIKSFSW